MEVLEPKDRRSLILNAAIKVFGDRGYAGCSIGDIAKLAGLKSAALIYHYFPSKLDILRTVVYEKSPAALLDDRREWLNQQPPEVGLAVIGTAYFQMIDQPIAGPVIRIVISEALRSEEFAKSFAGFGPVRMLVIVTNYLEAQMESGNIQKMDAVAAARSFIGPFTATLFYHIVWGHPLEPGGHEGLVKQYVQTFLYGAAVKRVTYDPTECSP